MEYSVEEKEKQREIGKQILLVDIIHQENDKELKGRFSALALTPNRLSEWFDMGIGEIELFVDTCASLDRRIRAEYAARYSVFCKRFLEKVAK